jgi:hypothetical protein
MLAVDIKPITNALHTNNKRSLNAHIMEAYPNNQDNVQGIYDSIDTGPIGSLQDEIGATWSNLKNQE